ncbi:THAP domain-containing protein 3 isoform X1 [Saimiri boliviensis]|uniref:THAP domain-containing protein 3 isoform X1 n=1 Tax=Saimiri boliviensis TaxID=27679 RepID=UPI003D77552F
MSEEWSPWEEQGGCIANTSRAAAWEPLPHLPQQPFQMASRVLPHPLQVGRPFFGKPSRTLTSLLASDPFLPLGSWPLGPPLSFLFPSLVLFSPWNRSSTRAGAAFPASGSTPGTLAGTGQVLEVRENTDPASERGNASSSQKEKVLPEAGAGEDGPGRNMNTALELQLPPNATGPVKQVLPQRPQATEAVGWLAGPAGLRRPRNKQPSDHSYALLDLDSLKKKLFLTLKENEKLRKRLQAQRLVMQRMSTHLRACKGHWGLQARLRPEQQS